MNLNPQRRDAPDINLTPLIDVVFLLLIFFMVSTTFKKDAQLKIDLPEASPKPTMLEKKVLEVMIDAEGRYFVDNKEVINRRIESVKRAIDEVTKDNKKVPLIIRADAKTSHQSVVIVMDAARQLGIVNLSIATVQSKEN